MSDFVQRPYVPGDTIAAISTPPGEGGIAIIRITGSAAIEVAERVFSGPVRKYESHTAHFGFVKDLEGKKIDEALLIVMKGRRSYAGEDTVELQCHGGMIASRRCLEAVLEAGARPAMPGEYTLKAFMNGKLDLAQAEAVQKMIGAKSERAFEEANKQLNGELSKKILQFQKNIIDWAAILEAWVDFPEEGLEFIQKEELCKRLQETIFSMQELLNTYQDGKKIHHGVSLCIVGAPNAGKSSLLNALLDKEKAIVTPIPGTTRDLVEEEWHLNGLAFRLIDTAGIRETEEIVEKEGIRRSHLAMQEADLVLFVIDSSKGIEDSTLLEKIPLKKTIFVWNKIDLAIPPCDLVSHPYRAFISAKEKKGLEELRKLIDGVVWREGTPPKEEIVLTSSRHKEALLRAKNACEKALEGLLRNESPEFLAFDIRQGLFELGTIIGKDISEEILSSIFSQFCIGK